MTTPVTPSDDPGMGDTTPHGPVTHHVAYADHGITVYEGDCLDVLAAIPDASIDSVVTDPPYGLEFMGQEWDRPWAVSPKQAVGYAGREDNLTLPSFGDNRNANCRACGGRQRGKKRCECANPRWDRDPAEDMRAFQEWCQAWATECLRVLKPGGHLVAFGGTRTYHRMVCGIEDAGFEIRDGLQWLYGSGFPKSLNVSKAIDKSVGAEREVTGEARRRASGVFAYDGNGRPQDASRYVSADVPTAPATEAARTWEGWGTALKPAVEPIVLARKPLTGTVAANVLAHGTGALNIDATRIKTTDPLGGGAERETRPDQKGHDGWERPWMSDPATRAAHAGRVRANVDKAEALGRWPANVLLTHHPDCVETGTRTIPGDKRTGGDGTRTGGFGDVRGTTDGNGRPAGPLHGSPDGTETIPAYDCHPDCPIHILDDQSADDANGASRFYYTAKATRDERPTINGISHPTVKPLNLITWLINLTTPPGGHVLDPFAGTGTTAEAAILTNHPATLIERNPDYTPLITARLHKRLNPVAYTHLTQTPDTEPDLLTLLQPPHPPLAP